jgi:uncharacterized membrane protein YdjX (TVP38/TMEM64 family)
MGRRVNTLLSRRLALVVGVVALLAAAYHFGLFSLVGEPKVLAQSLVGLGVAGYLAFVVTYALLQPFGVPGTIFVAAAPLIWPWPTAFALSLVGTMAASVVGFSFARFLARDWVSSRIPQRLRRYDEALHRNAFQTVVLLRMILWMPPPLHWFFGVSRVDFGTHFWGSLLGYVPPLLAVSYFGAQVFDSSGRLQPGAWPILGGMAAASLLVATLGRLWARRARRTDA